MSLASLPSNLERAGFDLFPPTKTSTSSYYNNYSPILTVTLTVTSTATTGGGFFGFTNKVTTTTTETKMTTITQTVTTVTTALPEKVTVTAPLPPQPSPPSIPIKDAINIIVGIVNTLHPKSPLLSFIEHLTQPPDQTIDLDILWKIVQEIIKNSLNPKPFPISALRSNPINEDAITSWVKEQLGK